jgi:hypothetical protein
MTVTYRKVEHYVGWWDSVEVLLDDELIGRLNATYRDHRGRLTYDFFPLCLAYQRLQIFPGQGIRSAQRALEHAINPPPRKVRVDKPRRAAMS